MKFTCSREAILAEISIAHEVVSARNTLSILSNVLLETHEHTLTIRATDLKVGFVNEIPVETGESGSTTVNCEKLLGILRSLPEGDIEFDQKEQRLHIRPSFKKIDFQIKSIESENFPELQQVGSDQFFEISQERLLAMVNQTIFAVSDDETRYFMNGVFVENDAGKLVMVATDGRRLSYIEDTADEIIPQFSGVIVPPKILSMIRKLSSGEGSLSIAVTEKHIFFRLNTKQLSSNLIEGQFPNYQRVIPESQEHEIVVDRNELNEALGRVSLLVEQKSRRIFLSVNEDTMLLHSEESEMGVAREEISCSYEGPEMSIALNYLYLLEPLRVMEDDAISIRFTDSKKAISVHPRQKKEYLHVIAPMQLD